MQCPNEIDIRVGSILWISAHHKFWRWSLNIVIMKIPNPEDDFLLEYLEDDSQRDAGHHFVHNK
jgi:hypothetical protein